MQLQVVIVGRAGRRLGRSNSNTSAPFVTRCSAVFIRSVSAFMPDFFCVFRPATNTTHDRAGFPCFPPEDLDQILCHPLSHLFSQYHAYSTDAAPFTRSLVLLPCTMSTGDDPVTSTAPVQHDQMETSPSLLSYGCTPWRISSQRVADLYNSGTKLWTKRDLLDIERQLEQSATLNRFTIQCVDGKQVQVKNPLFDVQAPIW